LCYHRRPAATGEHLLCGTDSNGADIVSKRVGLEEAIYQAVGSSFVPLNATIPHISFMARASVTTGALSHAAWCLHCVWRSA